MTLHINYGTTMARLGRLSNNPLAPWLAAVAIEEQKKAQARIETTKRDPDEQQWAPWRPSTKAYRVGKGNAARGLLYDEGALLAGIISKSDLHSAEIGVANSVHYAPWLQNGTPDMDARPILGWGTTTLAQLEINAALFLSKLK